MRRLELAGQRFARLTVLSFSEIRKKWSYWNCICDCGVSVVVMGNMLRTGQKKSCGCLNRDMTIARNKATATQGGEAAQNTAEYRAWRGMLSRCDNPNGKKYRLYGGRGITVCDRWRRSYSAFLSDMGRRPSNKHSIDRYPDKNGNYEPNNCRWATWSEQNSNRNTYTRRQYIPREDRP